MTDEKPRPALESHDPPISTRGSADEGDGRDRPSFLVVFFFLARQPLGTGQDRRTCQGG
jgi:hypothetical protein